MTGRLFFVDDNGRMSFGNDAGNVTYSAVLHDRVLDLGLSVLADEADKIYICSDEPTSYAEATGISPGYALASKDFGSPGGAFGPASSTTSPDAPGRFVASTAIADGLVMRTGTAYFWAAVDSANSRLLARGGLSIAVALSAGHFFSLPSFTLRM